MLPADLGLIDVDYLRRICDERWPESQTLEWKAKVPDAGDRGTHEFVKDVCALANGDGGDIVYGVDEENGLAIGIRAIQEPIEPLRRRLGQLLDARLEPRLIGLAMKEVAVNEGHVLILRVPASFNGPHRHHFNGQSKFVVRSGTHTSELTYEQLRMAFDRTATLGERARAFRLERQRMIIEGVTPRPVRPGPLCVVHLIPLAAMAGRQTVDIASRYNDYLPFMFADWGGASRDTNLDGLVVHPGREDGGVIGYTQVFRSGALEAMRYAGTRARESRDIPAVLVSTFVREAIAKLSTASTLLGNAGPAVLGVSLLSVAGIEFLTGERYEASAGTADREHLVLPEHWIESMLADFAVDAVAKPVLDVLWQSFGIERCLLYDPQGQWRRR